MLRAFPLLLTLWACVISAVYKPVLKDFGEGGIGMVLSEGLGANYIVWFSLIAATLILKDITITARLTPLIFPLLLNLYPSATLSWIAASCLSLYLLSLTRRHIAAILLLAACLREPLTALALKIFAGNILGFDAILTNWALSLMGQTALLQSNIVITGSGQPLLILTGCSVFANLSYMTLLWLSLHVFFQHKIDGISWIVLVLTVLLTLASNAFRLALMTTSTKAYIFYHDGLGSQLFEWGLLLGVLVIVLGACRHEKRI